MATASFLTLNSPGVGVSIKWPLYNVAKLTALSYDGFHFPVFNDAYLWGNGQGTAHLTATENTDEFAAGKIFLIYQPSQKFN